jgi:dUTP pyrophosphatase
MNNIASFHKVSFDEYKNARKKMFAVEGELTDDDLFDEWLCIKMPERATTGSAGYDFSIPMKQRVTNESVLIPTGIRAKINEGWVLMLFPRSGMGMKYRMALDNTTGVIDSDYYLANNEGHIMAIISVDTTFDTFAGDKFMQGIIVPFVRCGKASNEQRTGGFSTRRWSLCRT